MTKQFFHFLLILIFSVFTLSSNAFAQPITTAPLASQMEMSTADNSHAMADCHESVDAKNKSCCETDCSCMLSHCYQAQTLLPNSLTSFQTQHTEQIRQASSVVVHRSITPQKRPPKV